MTRPLFPRAEAVKVINELYDGMDRTTNHKLTRPVRDVYDHGRWHFGNVELRRLLDAIYGGPPQSEDEKL